MIIALAALAFPPPATDVVVVRAERLVEPSISTQRLTGDALSNQAGARLDEALRIVPGAGLFRRTSSGAANATIQGLSLRPIAPNGAGRALVSLDGVPQNDPFGGWIYWSRYDPNFLEQVEVKRGAAGAGFGPMALTGTLDLTEARGRPASVVASLGNEGGRYFTARQSLVTPGAVFTAMGGFEASDGNIPVAKRQRGAADRPADFQALSLTLVTDIARDNGAWSFRGSGFSEAKGAGLVGGQSEASGLDVSAARRFEGDWGQSRVLIYAQGRDFSNQTVAVTARRASTTPALDQFAIPSSAIGGSILFAPSPRQSQRLGIPQISVDWRRGEGQTQELFRNIGTGFTRARTAGGAQDLIGLGLFLPRPLPLSVAGLRFDGGLRVDYWANQSGFRVETDRATGAPTLNERHTNQSGTIVSGRLSLAQANGPVRLSLYRTFRPPTLNELHRPFRVGNDITEANAALQPETLIGLDLDFGTSRAWRSGVLTTSLTLYANQLSDPIANVTIGTGPGVFPRVGFLPAGGSLRERRNVGHIDATGLEARVSWGADANAAEWSLAASVTDARVDGGEVLPLLTGKRPAQAPNWSAAATLLLPINKTFSLSLVARGEGVRFEDDLNTRRLGAYGALDLRAAWRITNQVELFFAAQNALGAPIETAVAGDGVISLAQAQSLRIGLKLGR